MKVKYSSGTRAKSCTCGSWLEHWKKYSDEPLSIFCAVLDCIQKPEVGSHVRKDGADDTDRYIVPLCRAHNDRYWSSYYITDTVTLVSADVDRTCGSDNSRAADGNDNASSVMEANQAVKGKRP